MTEMTRSFDLRQWLLQHAPHDLREDLASACCTRGKRAGRVLASVPTAKGPRVVGAWRALMTCLAPQRAGLFAMIWADDEERAAYEACDEWIDNTVIKAADGVLGVPARNVVTLAGGAPFEFHLMHMNVDRQTLLAIANVADIDPRALGTDAE